jgi:hypothetical protein
VYTYPIDPEREKPEAALSVLNRLTRLQRFRLYKDDLDLLKTYLEDLLKTSGFEYWSTVGIDRNDIDLPLCSGPGWHLCPPRLRIDRSLVCRLFKKDSKQELTCDLRLVELVSDYKSLFIEAAHNLVSGINIPASFEVKPRDLDRDLVFCLRFNELQVSIEKEEHQYLLKVSNAEASESVFFNRNLVPNLKKPQQKHFSDCSLLRFALAYFTYLPIVKPFWQFAVDICDIDGMAAVLYQEFVDIYHKAPFSPKLEEDIKTQKAKHALAEKSLS